MFSNVRVGRSGLGSIMAVAFVAAAYVVALSTFIMATNLNHETAPKCQLVCARVPAGHQG